ncbi:MAG TPA: hypothetical protein VIO62_10485 [Candidatus Dormibacteraeota bacterium]
MDLFSPGDLQGLFDGLGSGEVETKTASRYRGGGSAADLEEIAATWVGQNAYLQTGKRTP